tara:strand:- start:5295 stop:5954 length:660 start_codon:yes stop_codon:yes gene_type:complete
MSIGWIKLHRKILDNPIFKNDKLFRVFIYLLLKASHTEHEQLIGDSIVSLKTGQWATGRKAISRDTGLTEQNVRTAISKLEKLGILTIKVTVKYSIFSISKWEGYQQDNQQVTNKQPAGNQQVTTNKNGKNENNGDNKDQSSLINDGFDHWWKFYPKKADKKKSLAKFKLITKKLNDGDFNEFVNMITKDCKKRFANTEKSFIPNATTYLNGERWNDEY